MREWLLPFHIGKAMCRDANPNQRIAILCSIALPCVNPGASFPSRLLSQNSNGAATVWQPPCVVYQACSGSHFEARCLNTDITPHKHPEAPIREYESGLRVLTAISPGGTQLD